MKILIIEDEVRIANLLKKNLETSGHEVIMAHNGTDGLKMAESVAPNVIILDIMLPGMNGFKVAKSLRDQKNDTPIIMLTARNTTQDKADSFEAGANDYLVKPVNFDTLLDRINNLSSPNKNAGTRIFSRKEDLAISSNQPVTKVVRKEIIEMRQARVETIEKLGANKTKVTPRTPSLANANLDANIYDYPRHRENSIEVDALNKSIMDYAPMSIITINKDGFITSANKYFKTISKTKKFKNHNVFASEFFIRENLVPDYKSLLTDGKIIRREHCHEVNSKGEDKYLKIIATPIYDTNGNIDGALSMALDNTEEVISKDNLIDLNNNLELTIRQRTEELKKTNEELTKALKIKAAFAADVSHEMRTSLAIIQGNLELLARTKAISEAGAESSVQIFQEINRMSEMLSNLTSLNNADAVQKLNLTRFNFNELINSVCSALKVVALEKNIQINYTAPNEAIEILADRARLEELLLNLIRNAIKYNKINGWIKISAKRSGRKLCIKIEDSGFGIAKKHLPYVFERFYRIDSARTRNSGGSGLGLAICKWIAEIHGGTISVESTIGLGSTFTICLPVETKITDAAEGIDKISIM